jgi:hypothetical protein
MSALVRRHGLRLVCGGPHRLVQAEKAAGRSVVTLGLKSALQADPNVLFNSDEAVANGPQLVLG